MLILLSVVFASCQPEQKAYQKYEGPIFGTSFHITYEYTANQNLNEEILTVMEKFNASLSNYDPNSVISRMNSNDSDVRADEYFETCFKRAEEISRHTHGAFDITVAPMVNLWGFGFKAKDSATTEKIDSLLQITGYDKVKLQERKLLKEDPDIMLDVSAIAKGYGVDVVSEFLESQGINNYLVEIGGELRCRGINPKGLPWSVGIDKPIESMVTREIQAILHLSDISMATSGNYRQFYVENGVKYSHTINPKTGYPVRHSLLSATVISSDCMSADGYATAFMVMGLEPAKAMILEDPALEGVLIYSDESGAYQTWVSPGLIDKIELDQ